MISIRHSGDLKKTEKFLKKSFTGEYLNGLDKYGVEGVLALALATPYKTGKTASSWDYEIHRTKGTTSIIWTNSNINKGVNIAVILQYGHGTRNGGYVRGIDYINPAMKPIFEEIARKAWEEVTRD